MLMCKHYTYINKCKQMTSNKGYLDAKKKKEKKKLKKNNESENIIFHFLVCLFGDLRKVRRLDIFISKNLIFLPIAHPF